MSQRERAEMQGLCASYRAVRVAGRVGLSANKESCTEGRAPRLHRVRRRRAIVLVILIGVATLTITDVRGRMEVGHLDGAQGIATARLARFEADLEVGRIRIGTESGKLEAIESKIAQQQSTLVVTRNQTTAHYDGIFIDDLDFSALKGCLAGVTQALDQISVGETSGGLASLSAVGPTCKSASP